MQILFNLLFDVVSVIIVPACIHGKQIVDKTWTLFGAIFQYGSIILPPCDLTHGMRQSYKASSKDQATPSTLEIILIDC